MSGGMVYCSIDTSKRSQTAKKRFSVAFYILYILRTWYVVIITLFSLFCSFSAHCAHCYIVMFCYSTHYTILLFSFLVSLLENTVFAVVLFILHPVFLSISKKTYFYFIVFQHLTTS